MKKIMFIAGVATMLLSCQNQPSKETVKLGMELDSIKHYETILTKYMNHKSDLLAKGFTDAEATKMVDSMYQASYPAKGAEWDK